MKLLDAARWPAGFTYPAAFLRIAELGLTNLEPWHVLDGVELEDRAIGLASRYPERTLVPFARRQDNDDVACWESGGRKVVIIHDFASPGWEQQGEFGDFHAWLRQAIDELIDWQETDEWTWS